MLSSAIKEVPPQPLPSLERLVLTKLTISLFKQQGMMNLLERCFGLKCFQNKVQFREDKDWKMVHSKADEKVSQLPLTEKLKKKLLGFIWPIGLEILTWIEHWSNNPYLSKNIPTDFHWTVYGKIDTKKTAEKMIKDEKVNLLTRYNLACVYCLEDDVRALWEKLPEFSKKDLRCTKDTKIVLSKHGSALAYYWTRYIQEEPDAAHAPKHLLELVRAVHEGDKTAMVNVFLKLNNNKRLLTTYVEHIPELNFSEYDRIDVFYFFVSNLREEGQLNVLKQLPSYMIECFLSWPRQTSFLNIMKQMWTNDLGVTVFDDALLKILSKDLEGYIDFDYRDLFVKTWQESPESYKAYVRAYPRFCGSVLSQLIQYKFVFASEEDLQETACASDTFKNPANTIFVLDDDKRKFLKFLSEEGIITKHLMKQCKLNLYCDRLFSYSFNRKLWEQHLILIHRCLGDENN